MGNNYTPEERGWLRGIDETNAEWVRVLTHYVPNLKLAVYSPQTVGEFLKAALTKQA